MTLKIDMIVNTDKSGTISKSELNNVFKALDIGLDERKLEVYMGVLDPQKTGTCAVSFQWRMHVTFIVGWFRPN